MPDPFVWDLAQLDWDTTLLSHLAVVSSHCVRSDSGLLPNIVVVAVVVC